MVSVPLARDLKLAASELRTPNMSSRQLWDIDVATPKATFYPADYYCHIAAACVCRAKAQLFALTMKPIS